MFWDKVAGVYDIFVNVYNPGVHRHLRRAVDALIAPTDDVLECACGTGMLTVGMARRCHSLVATDYSEKMLARAQRKCQGLENARFETANILRLNYADERFDKVVAANVIHLLDEPLTALAELNRVCKSGGRLILPTYMNQERSGQASAFSRTVGRAGADFKRQFTYRSYQQFFREAGFERGTFMLIEGRVPCALAVLERK